VAGGVVGVVVVLALGHDAPEVLFAVNKQMIEALSARRPRTAPRKHSPGVSPADQPRIAEAARASRLWSIYDLPPCP
jgi:hypothetical protein